MQILFIYSLEMLSINHASPFISFTFINVPGLGEWIKFKHTSTKILSHAEILAREAVLLRMGRYYHLCSLLPSIRTRRREQAIELYEVTL